MTVTTLETPLTAETPAQVVYLEHAEPLWRAMSNALLFTASKTAYLPVLESVCIEQKAGAGKLSVVSTDRYRMFVEDIEHNSNRGEGFKVLISAADVKQLLPLLKSAGRLGSAMLLVGEKELKVSAGIGEITLSYVEGDFPDWRKVVVEDFTAEPTGEIAFDPAFLGHLGKLKLDTKKTPAQFQFNGPLKPALIRFDGGPRIWQMPIRLAGQQAPQPRKAQEKEKAAA